MSDWYFVGNDWYSNVHQACPTVTDHFETDTGLVDSKGVSLRKPPNPIGFGRDKEWYNK